MRSSFWENTETLLIPKLTPFPGADTSPVLGTGHGLSACLDKYKDGFKANTECDHNQIPHECRSSVARPFILSVPKGEVELTSVCNFFRNFKIQVKFAVRKTKQASGGGARL